ncbi:hypothetical protein JTB14_018124 [Gonioctena quinquepunctata]|nr:hypothetical protein JTB14_018124 [Gonioctena quinquepunctata]
MEIDTSYPQEVREKPPPTLYPKIITQSDGPSDCLSSSSEDEKEDIKHLSMTKKDEQYKRNVKRRKTSKTKEEMEVDQDDRKANLERMEKGKSKPAKDGKHITVDDKNEDYTKLNKFAPPAIILEGKPIFNKAEYEEIEKQCDKKCLLNTLKIALLPPPQSFWREDKIPIKS